MKKVMSAEALEARRAYARAYRAKNPEKFREYRRRYWEKMALLARQHKEQQADGGEDHGQQH